MRNWIWRLTAAAALASFAGAAMAQNFDDPKEFQAAKELLAMKPQGPEGKPWEQHLGGKEVDTSKYKKPGPYRVCFSNAGVNNPWRVVGWTDMQAQVDVLKSDIKSFTAADAEGKDDKQISDINSFVSGGNCDILIVSPNTTAALTPAVEVACQKLPVIVFDRGVLTQCPVTFINPIGGYGWGIQTADFIVSKLPKDGKVLALRILPGVDVLETRWSAAHRIFKEHGVNVVGAEFTNGDNAKTKSIVEDYINRFGKIDAVWMDAGATAVAALEAFEDTGESDSLAAVDVLTDAKTLSQIIKTTTRESVARQALVRLHDQRALGSVARHAVLESARPLSSSAAAV